MTASMLHGDLLAEASEPQASVSSCTTRGSATQIAESQGAAAPLPVVKLAAVYEAQSTYVFRCLRGLGVRDGNIEDAVHDVFLVVHDKLHTFHGPAKLRTWLYAIVLRVARRYRERQAQEAREPGVEPVDRRCAEARLLSHEQLELARGALDGLSQEKREVFVLSEIEELSAPEIAAITACPLNTVYSRLRAARSEFDRRIALSSRKQQGSSR